MGVVIVESAGNQIHTEKVVLDNGLLKDKKKKRRSKRSKQNSALSASSSVPETCVDESVASVGDTLSTLADPSGYHQSQSYVFGFNSMPTMHINEPTVDVTFQHRQELPENRGELSYNSCPNIMASEESVGYSLYARPAEFKARRRCFPPYWSSEVVTEAIKKGEAIIAKFRVNAHNRLEAYCKIDGLQTDVLVDGMVAQNRAVEGDTVAIVVDPPSLWPKMKGSNESLHNSTLTDNSLHQSEAVEHDQDSCQQNKKLDSEKGIHYGNASTSETVVLNGSLNGVAENGYVNGCQPYTSDSFRVSCSINMNDSVNSVEKLSSTVSSLPSKRPTGRVVAVIERSPRRETIVGFLSVKQWISSRQYSKRDTRKNNHQHDLDSGHVFLSPTDPRFSNKMMVPVRSLPESIKKRLELSDAAVERDLVGARIVEWSEGSYTPEALITHLFGRGSDIEAQIRASLFEHAINASEFSSEILSCLPPISWEVPQEELGNRRDLRDLCIFTIDPATATDLDDALSVEKLSNGTFRVGVHIADVSYFVLPGTAVDVEAQIRSTSFYMLHRKLPMLPSVLSDNLLSLNPGVDRLAFSIFWDINAAGEVLDRWIGRTIMHSCCKLSYEHVQEIINGLFDSKDSSCMGNQWPQLHGEFEWSDIIRSVKNLHEISKILKQNRFSSGALSLESPKVVFLFDEEGIPYDSMISGLKDSNFLVEEFMLLANRTAAEVIARAYPSCALLRRHPEPNMRKLREFEAFCSKHGLELDISSPGKIYQSLEHNREVLKNDSVLFDIMMSYAARPMQLAEYFCTGLRDADSDWGHYALAVPLYTHFTSPLRRYPDIVVHRTVAAALEAEEIYLNKNISQKSRGEIGRCFTGLIFDREAIESIEAQGALSIAASKHGVPSTDSLADVATHCNNRKLASRHMRDATNKLYMWALLKKRQILLSEARVLGLGPRFMSIYISKLAIERRIYYDEVEGLTVEWLDATSTLILSRCTDKLPKRRGGTGKFKALEDVALIVRPCDSDQEMYLSKHSGEENGERRRDGEIFNSGLSDTNIEPVVFPLTMQLLATIPVALHAIGGDDGPLDIGARLYMNSYIQ